MQGIFTPCPFTQARTENNPNAEGEPRREKAAPSPSQSSSHLWKLLFAFSLSFAPIGTAGGSSTAGNGPVFQDGAEDLPRSMTLVQTDRVQDDCPDSANGNHNSDHKPGYTESLRQCNHLLFILPRNRLRRKTFRQFVFLPPRITTEDRVSPSD